MDQHRKYMDVRRITADDETCTEQEVRKMIFDQNDKVVKAPDALNHPLYKLTKAFVKAAKLRNSLVGTKEEVLAKSAKMNAKNRRFTMPTDNKAHYS